MHKGDYLHRDMTGYAIELIMQGDGNLVLKATNGHVCWASNTVDGGSGESGQTVSLNTHGEYWVGYKKSRNAPFETDGSLTAPKRRPTRSCPQLQSGRVVDDQRFVIVTCPRGVAR